MISGLFLGMFIQTRTDIYPENIITTVTGSFIQPTNPIAVSAMNIWLIIISLFAVIFNVILIAFRPSGIVVGSLSLMGALVLFFSPAAGILMIIVGFALTLFFPEVKA